MVVIPSCCWMREKSTAPCAICGATNTGVATGICAAVGAEADGIDREQLRVLDMPQHLRRGGGEPSRADEALFPR